MKVSLTNWMVDSEGLGQWKRLHQDYGTPIVNLMGNWVIDIIILST